MIGSLSSIHMCLGVCMRRLVRFLSISLLSVVSLWPVVSTAQERHGTITGRVTDSSQSVLPGARIEMQPGTITAVSDGQGAFTITNLAAGKYTRTGAVGGFEPFSTGG